MFKKSLITMTLVMFSTVALAASVTNTFQTGNTIVASEVNQNFTDLVDAITALEAKVAELENPTIDASFLNGETYCLNSILTEVGAADSEQDGWSYSANGIARGKLVFTGTTTGTFQLTTDDFYNNGVHPLANDGGADPADTLTYSITNGILSLSINDPEGGTFDVDAAVSPDGNVLSISSVEFDTTTGVSAGKYAFTELLVGIRSSGSCITP